MTVRWKHNGNDDFEHFARNPSETDDQLRHRVIEAIGPIFDTASRKPDYGSNITVEWDPK